MWPCGCCSHRLGNRRQVERLAKLWVAIPQGIAGLFYSLPGVPIESPCFLRESVISPDLDQHFSTPSRSDRTPGSRHSRRRPSKRLSSLAEALDVSSPASNPCDQRL